jgi:ABC-2 type transport system ATP-binding protein
MEEADHLCDRVAIMDRGKVIALDSPAALKRSIGELEIIEVKATGVSGASLAKLRKLRGIRKVVPTPKGLRVLTPTADAMLGQIIDALTSTGRMLIL